MAGADIVSVSVRASIFLFSGVAAGCRFVHFAVVQGNPLCVFFPAAYIAFTVCLAFANGCCGRRGRRRRRGCR